MSYNRRNFFLIIGSLFGERIFTLIRFFTHAHNKDVNSQKQILAEKFTAFSFIKLSKPKQESARIIVISDLNGRYGSTSYDSEVIKSISLIKQWKPDLVLCAGDMIAGQKYSLTKKQIQAMWIAFDIQIASHLRRLKIPFGFTIGNHDGSGLINRNKLIFERERTITSRFWKDSQHNPGLNFLDKSHYPFYYTFKQKNIFFLVLDASTHIISPEQLSWISNSLESLESKQAKFHFAIGHLPLYPIAIGRNSSGNFIKNGEKLHILLEKYNVHTYISGHHHAYYPGKKGALELLYSGALGGGSRRLLTSQSLPKKTLTIIDVSLNLKKTTYTTYNMNNLKIIDIKTLPKLIGKVQRKDLSFQQKQIKI